MQLQHSALLSFSFMTQAERFRWSGYVCSLTLLNCNTLPPSLKNAMDGVATDLLSREFLSEFSFWHRCSQVTKTCMRLTCQHNCMSISSVFIISSSKHQRTIQLIARVVECNCLHSWFTGMWIHTEVTTGVTAERAISARVWVCAYSVGFKLLPQCIVCHLQGYRDPLNVRMHELPISVEDAKILFAEIREIRDFNRCVLYTDHGWE